MKIDSDRVSWDWLSCSPRRYHVPRTTKHYLPEHVLPDLLWLPLADLSFFELILKNHPIPIGIIVSWVTLPG